MDLGTIGNLLLGLASVSAIASIGAYAFSSREGGATRTAGHLMTFGVFGFISLAIILLATAFLSENWSLQYVIYNHPTVTGPWAWVYRLSGVWAGREGSLLFWEWILAIYGAFLAGKFMKNDSKLGATGLAIVNFVQLFFLAALFIDTNNPFKAAPAGLVDPATGALLTSAAMNPLLQTWAMVLHPPTLFIGYAGLTVPFAFGLAALFTGDVSATWVKLTDRITVFSWLLLGIGIGLGSVWAYYELAFGGYWAWDPVENASLLPWLTGVGLIHSMTVYRRREGFRMWTFMMAAFTFVFVLLGTFITRSGIVQSVHAFQEDPLSFWLFLLMMIGSIAVMAAGVIMRRNRLSSEADGFEQIMSKEGSYYFNNVLMLISAVLVAYMTMASAFPEWMPLGGQSIKAPAYDALARPLGIFYILVMTLCPILAWGGGDMKKLWEKAKGPLAVGTPIAVGFLAVYVFAMLPYFTPTGATAEWWHHFLAVSGVIVAGYAIGLPLWLFFDGARKRAAARGESLGAAFGWIVTKARTQTGGYLAHLGMGIILIGLVGSTMFVRTHNAQIPQQPGATYEAEGYTFTFVSLDQTQENVRVGATQGDTVYTVNLDVSKDGRAIKTMRPQLRFPQQLAQQNQSTQHVSLLSEVFKDVFISFSGVDDTGSAVVTIKFFPMQWWVWSGFAILIIGSGIASWPKKSRLAA
ncbi:heme lyase CcmF/NrfE family subunit [Anaerosoma tenue]|uniref:heme lyase CcmF/NrfE family subunit n=1 Tax=Anaerosoma tenue TaxID=2933588 RepID=UPI0022610328|nr:cytochrome c biogenesis protein CcsA [Anaerosoma tenue]MCK8114710.1 cytochrome c biogenesis protein CcsA [Anaerosoma tenue]